MPPAFNLSQDQTLQFNPSRPVSRAARTQKIPLTRILQRMSTSIHNTSLASSTTIYPKSVKPPQSTQQYHQLASTSHNRMKHPHASAVQVFKERNWLRGQDLNLRPSGYEPDELPDCSTPRPSEIEKRNSSNARHITQQRCNVARARNQSVTHSRIGCHCSVSRPLTESGRSKILKPLKAAFAYT